MDLIAIADELYGLAADRFTSERNARAKQVRGGGNRELADEIAALPKPSASAWLANAIARAHPDEIDQLVRIGEALRTAQESDPDRAKLRELSTARRQLVGAIADLGTALAEESGRAVSASVRDEVEQTLGAALADTSAADALRTGRLVRALSTDGLDASRPRRRRGRRIWIALPHARCVRRPIGHAGICSRECAGFECLG